MAQVIVTAETCKTNPDGSAYSLAVALHIMQEELREYLTNVEEESDTEVNGGDTDNCIMESQRYI